MQRHEVTVYHEMKNLSRVSLFHYLSIYLDVATTNHINQTWFRPKGGRMAALS
jgi:hypothetical protein